MTPPLDLATIQQVRRRHDRLGLRAPQSRRAASPTLAPAVRVCWYRREDDSFVVKFDDGRRVVLARNLLTPPTTAEILGCEVDDVRRGVEVALADGSVTSFSGDFALYATDAYFRVQVEERTRARRRPERSGSFGKRVREARNARGWSLAVLGERTGMAPPNVHRIESGKHLPSSNTVLLMADALGVTVAWLLAGELEPESR